MTERTFNTTAILIGFAVLILLCGVWGDPNERAAESIPDTEAATRVGEPAAADTGRQVRPREEGPHD